MEYKKDREDPEKIRVVETTNIPVIEESITISKEQVATGKVTIKKTIHEEKVAIDLPLKQEKVEVEIVPINKYVDSAPEVRNEGDTIVYPVIKEVVEKRLVLVEEVRVTKKTIQADSHEEIILRKEEVNVERVRLNTGNPENFK